MGLLQTINSPDDLRNLTRDQLDSLCQEIRDFIVASVARTGGHLGSNLGAVELTLAIHRTFDSPHDVILFDTGHQAYVHKIVTGRRDAFTTLRQEGGLSGYPNQAESPHDWIENSHASTVLSYAHGLSIALSQANATAHRDAESGTPMADHASSASHANHASITARATSDGRPTIVQHADNEISAPQRSIVAVIGDGALTGGLAFEALNNLGHSNTPCVIVLNDNGRSYAPTVSKLSANLTKLRMHPTYVSARRRFTRQLGLMLKRGAVGEFAYSTAKSVKAAVREFVEPQTFFEALGVRYLGPIDGHDIVALEEALQAAKRWNGPIVVHALTQKGRGYSPAETDDEKHLHDAPSFDPMTGPEKWRPAGYTQAFSDAIVAVAAADKRVYAITAAMPGPTGLIPFSQRFPQRFIDVGIAEQHAATMAAGLAMGGLRPVVAIYSTFFNRCFDQAAYDVALHRLPVVFVLDRAGITGDDGASHHGVLDMSLCLNIPEMTILAPASAQDLSQMLKYALTLDGPSVIRFPKGAARNIDSNQLPPYVSGMPIPADRLTSGKDVCILAVGKMVETAETVIDILATQSVQPTLWDVRSVRPLDVSMLRDALTHQHVIIIEDGIKIGGAGSWIADQLRELHQTLAHEQTTLPLPDVQVLGIPAEFIAHAKPTAIHQQLGLDAQSIAKSILQLVSQPLR